MANRIPLVFDSTDSKIKELPASDNLNLSQSSIIDAINVTATGTITAGVGNFTSLRVGGNPIGDVAISNDYNDLDNLPDLFSGDYNDLINKPPPLAPDWANIANKPVIATSLSQLINDTNFVSNSQVIIAASQVTGLSDIATSGSWTDLVDANQLVTKSEISGGTLTIDVNNTGDLEGSVYSVDGVLMVDAVNRRFIGPLFGTLTGEFFGNSTGIHTGDVYAGSIFGTDSAQLVDCVSHTHYGNFEGVLFGDVFGYDSNKIINAENSTVNATLSGNINKLGSILNVSSDSGIQLLPNGLLSVPNATNIDINATVAIDIEATDNLSLTSTSGNVIVDGGIVYIGQTGDSVSIPNEDITIGKAGGSNNFYGSSYFDGALSAGLYFRFPYYATVGARNSAIPSPVAGMVVLTGNKFTGYILDTGGGSPGWVDLN